MITRPEALEVKCGREFTVNASHLIEIMESVSRYPRANYFELACALCFVSGRDLAELVGTANLSPSGRSPNESEVKIGASRVATAAIA